jgi:thioredoxin reductase (NADPH)
MSETSAQAADQMRSHADVAIIGAGPVGLFAIFECGMLGMRCHVFDALDSVGGQCAALYPEKPIYDIPAHPRIEAAELIERLSEQAKPFAPSYHLGAQIDRLARDGENWVLTDAAGQSFTARTVIVAAGVGAFGPNRPPLAGIEAYEGQSVHYYVKRREDFRGKRVVIAGGGDSAVDWALSLADIAAQVMVVHRRPKFRAAPESAARLERLAANGAIEMVIPFQLAGLEGSGSQISSVIVESLKGERRTLGADALLPFFGLSMNLGPIAEWGLDLDHHHITVDPASCATNASGIFAIGDIATYPGKLKLILSGFAEAALAAHGARKLVFPGEELHFEYSTSSGVPALG